MHKAPPSVSNRPAPTDSSLRRAAEALADQRKEAPHTGHLLVALQRLNARAAQLLAERRLNDDTLLRGLRVAQDDDAAAMNRVLSRARDAASRHQRDAKDPTTQDLHVLYALCQEPKTAAWRILEQCGVDPTKLRTVALQVALGLRALQPQVTDAPPRARASAATHAVPLLPKPGQRPGLGSGPSSAPRGVAMSAPPATPAPTQPVTSPNAPTPTPVAMSTPAAATLSSAGVLVGAATAAATRPTGNGGSRAKGRKPKAGVERGAALDAKQFPTLAALGRPMTSGEVAGAGAQIWGRDHEVERALDILAKKTANCPCLVGPAGVGKTTVAIAIARHLAAAGDPRALIEVSAAALLANTALRGQLSERMAALRGELGRAQGRFILFIDDLQQLVGAEAGEESIGELRRLFSEAPCLTAMPAEDFRRHIERDPSLSRKLVAVEVGELSREDAFLALAQMCIELGAHHHVHYTDEVIAQSIGWTTRYVTDKTLPDKALQILDLAGARAHRTGDDTLRTATLAEVASELIGVPAERLTETDADRILRFEQLVAERVVGHEAEIGRIGAVLRRNASGLGGARPIGAFLLLGSTGVGKTETAKAVAAALFHSETALTRLDMSEYAEPHAIARLVGAPPGYVGFEAGGQLTEAVRRRPYQVLLLDEIEKAHKDVLEAFLQVLDEGRMTDGRGRTVDFTHTVIFATSNLGAEATRTASRRSLGFGAQRNETMRLEEAMVQSARAELSPEFFNRFDEVMVFSPLSLSAVRAIAERLLARLCARLSHERGIALRVGEGVVDFVLQHGGYDEELGARPLRRALGRWVESPLADLLLRQEATRGDSVRVEVCGAKLRCVVEDRGGALATA